MILFEEHAALLLTAHAIFALLTVAISTHLVVWLRRYLRGNFGKRRSVVRFAVLSAGAYAITVLLGLALYPTYKVRVRAEYLQNPSRIHRSAELEVQARKQVLKQERLSRQYRSGQEAGKSAGSPEEALDEPAMDADARRRQAEEISSLANAKIQRGEKLSRWFDVKEHWALLGLLLSLALCGILLAWKPDKESKMLAKPVAGLAFVSAAIAWAAAIIGLATAAAHSVVAL